MAGLCEGGNELPSSLKASNHDDCLLQRTARSHAFKGDPQAKRAFYRYQRAIRRKHKIHIITDFADKIESLQPCGKEFWTFTKNLLGKTTHSGVTPLQNAHGEMVYDPQAKAEVLSNSFQQRFQPHQHPSDAIFNHEVTTIAEQIRQQQPEETIPHVTPNEVKTIIQKLPLNKAAGPDLLSSRMEMCNNYSYC
ncbi:hypothetical protein ANN_10866 [Periplaneta americana]|uniref:Uncharacterized protein n=1 Tax=Periplaneta americana TaxID=6978 RepID=A0ABQ8T540_PERAM|nr:hypothetical protein ANN_10866 [Periplaneta americana]